MGRPKKEKDNVAPESPETNKSRERKPKKEKKTISLNEVLKEVEKDIESIPVEVADILKPTYDLTLIQELGLKEKVKTKIEESQKIINVSELVYNDPEEVITDETKSNEINLPKTYVVDTSIILDDVQNIFVLSQNNSNTLIIPETVLDELDNKKKGFSDINFHAREFNRLLDQATVIDKQVITLIDGTKVTSITVELDDKTKLDLVSKSIYNVNVNNELISIVNDRKILEIAQCVSKDLEVTVVSNDTALRTRAMSLDLKAEPLKKNRQSDIEELNLIETINITSDMKTFIGNRDCTPAFFNKKFSNFTNVVFNCTDTGEQILTFYKFKQFHILNERHLRSFPVKPKNKEQLFFMNMLLDKDIPIVVCSGVTGSGKNLLSLAGSLQYVNNADNNKPNSGIKYCRNTVTAGDETAQLGFLKGDEAQKLSVFSYPLLDSIDNYIEIVQNNSKSDKKSIPVISQKQFMEDNNVSILNINQMRGSNIHGFIILDEWQNSSISVTKLMMTRINEGSKVVILGDLKQIDNAYLNKYNNGLSKMLKLATTEDMVAGIKLKRVQRGKIAEFAEKVFNDC